MSQPHLTPAAHDALADIDAKGDLDAPDALVAGGPPHAPAPDPTRPRQLHLPALLTFVAVAAAPLLLSAFVEPLHAFGLVLELGDRWADQPMLLSPGTPGRLLLGPLYLLLAGGVAAVVGRGRIAGEAMVGGLLAVALQLGLWSLQVDGQLGLFGKQPLVILPADGSTAFLFLLPGFALVTALPAAYWLAGQCGALVGAALVEQVTGKARCTACGTLAVVRKPPVNCAVCGIAAARPGVQWRAVGLGVGVALAAVLALVLGLGSSLGAYYRCNPKSVSGECDAAIEAYETSDGWIGYESRPPAGTVAEPVLVLLHRVKYLALVAAVVFALAGVLAARVVLTEMATAMIAVLLTWLGAVLLGVVLFSTPLVQGSAVAVVQLHLLGLLVWMPAGLVGAIVGQHFRKPITDEMLDAAMG